MFLHCLLIKVLLMERFISRDLNLGYIAFSESMLSVSLLKGYAGPRLELRSCIGLWVLRLAYHNVILNIFARKVKSHRIRISKY
jgi:hypothetical protein